MTREQFEGSQGLLRKVMTKQTGVIEKAWLEALMNSVDANATEVKFNITKERTEITDDGDSMSEDEVQKYFKTFGLDDDDIEDKEFGRFRMGRGQIFTFGVNVWRAKNNYMVVSIEDGSVEVELPDCDTEEDESIISDSGNEYKVNTEGLSYAMLSADGESYGISIQVDHYENLEDVDNSINEFKNLARYISWLHDVEVIVNGESLDDEPEVYEETKLAYFCEGYTNYKTDSPVYNKGAYVDDFDLGPKSVTIITKHDLDVTLDRTDILDHDQKWQQIQDQYVEVVVSELEENPDMTTTQRSWMLRKASDNRSMMNRLADVPLMEDINGDVHSIEDISGSQFSFAEKEDQLAQDAMRKSNVAMLNEKQKGAVNDLVQSANEMFDESDAQEYSEVIEEKMQFEMTEISRSELSKRRTQNLDSIEGALRDLGFRLDINAGYSNHKRVWKTEDDELFVHKDELNCTKTELATSLIQKVLITAAHSGETITSFDDGFTTSRNVFEAIVGDKFAADVDYATVQQRLIDGQYK
jgi:hypothetical protein